MERWTREEARMRTFLNELTDPQLLPTISYVWALILAPVLAGCGRPIKIGEPGQTAWLWKSPGEIEVVVRTCPEAISGDECSKLPMVEFTTNTEDREAWQFEWWSNQGGSQDERSRWRRTFPGYYQTFSLDVIVAGPKASCEALRLEIQGPRDRIFPCEGPLYFRVIQ